MTDERDTLELLDALRGHLIAAYPRRPTGSGGHPPTSEGDRQRGPKQTR